MRNTKGMEEEEKGEEGREQGRKRGALVSMCLYLTVMRHVLITH